MVSCTSFSHSGFWMEKFDLQGIWKVWMVCERSRCKKICISDILLSVVSQWNQGMHSVSWVGDLSYSKLKVEREPRIIGCPDCGGDFVLVYYNLDRGVHPVVPPDRHFEDLVDMMMGVYELEIIFREKYKHLASDLIAYS